MFTGIIEEVGRVRSVRRGSDSAALEIAAHRVLAGTKVGDSIAVNGVCLTVTSLVGSQANAFQADVMFETLRSSNLGDLRPGSRVNLERALALGGRLGGHIVTGHIDGIGAITEKKSLDIATLFTVRTNSALVKYIVKKGSVAIDGISLTVVDVLKNGFTVSIIPHTAQETTLHSKIVGETVNLETDLLAKYVEKLLGAGHEQGDGQGVTMDLLNKYGFA